MKDGKIYCEKDFHKLFAPTCNMCNNAICEDQYISANEKNYHPEHFVCFQCKTKFLGFFFILITKVFNYLSIRSRILQL